MHQWKCLVVLNPTSKRNLKCQVQPRDSSQWEFSYQAWTPLSIRRVAVSDTRMTPVQHVSEIPYRCPKIICFINALTLLGSVSDTRMTVAWHVSNKLRQVSQKNCLFSMLQLQHTLYSPWTHLKHILQEFKMCWSYVDQWEVKCDYSIITFFDNRWINKC